MTSTIHADKIMNSSGDQDSGLDLLVNDQVKIKTANTDRITITDSAASMGDNFKLKLGIGNDLNLYHDGSNSYIEDTGTGDTHVVSNHIRLRADNINLSNNANSLDGLTIDSNGIIKKPKVPAFQAYYASNTYCWSDTTDGGFHLQTLNQTRFNRGNHYNTTNHRFVAPVAGVYQFYGQFYTNYTSNYARAGTAIYVNGVGKSETWIGNYDTATSSTTTLTIELAANDYVQLYTALYDGNATSNNYNVYCGASYIYLNGHLIG